MSSSEVRQRLGAWLACWETFAFEIGAEWTPLPQELREACFSNENIHQATSYLYYPVREGGAARLWVDDWPVRLEPRLDVSGRRRMLIISAFSNPQRFRFAVRALSKWDRFCRELGLGAERTLTSDPAFDERCCVQPSESRQACRLFADPELRAALSACEQIEAAAGRHPSLSWVDLPDPVDLVWLEAAAPDIATLRAAFAAFRSLIRGLDVVLGRPLEPAARWLAALDLPDNGQSRRSLRLWEPRERKERAIRELVALADRRCVPALVRLLDDPGPGVRIAAATRSGSFDSKRRFRVSYVRRAISAPQRRESLPGRRRPRCTNWAPEPSPRRLGWRCGATSPAAPNWSPSERTS
jgi:hypothetical protein